MGSPTPNTGHWSLAESLLCWAGRDVQNTMFLMHYRVKVFALFRRINIEQFTCICLPVFIECNGQVTELKIPLILSKGELIFNNIV